MKKFLAVLLFALITTLSFGQSNYQDVVYMKNGSIIRGVIIEQVPGKSIKIETADRNVFVYQMDEIEKLTKEPYQSVSGSSHNNKGLNKGYKGIVEFGYEIGNGEYGMDRLKLNVINGHQFNPYFSMGFGIGLRYYPDADAELIPVFADFRANFSNSKVSPYLSLGLGYSFDATNDFEPVGLLLDPTVGVSIKISERSAMNVGLGYEMQDMPFFHQSYYYYNESIENSGAISINIGFSF